MTSRLHSSTSPPPRPPAEDVLITPLFIHPPTTTLNKFRLDQEFSPRTIQRLVSPHSLLPPSLLPSSTTANTSSSLTGEIVVTIEEDQNANKISSTYNTISSNLQRRLCIRSGIDESLHASLALDGDLSFRHQTPEEKDDYADEEEGKKYSGDLLNIRDPIVCWCSFDNNDDDSDNRSSSSGGDQLCVLSHPSLLRIFHVNLHCVQDVGGGGDGNSSTVGGNGGQGHVVPLPFEAGGIFSMGGTKGFGSLLVQRCATMDDWKMWSNAADAIVNEGWDWKGGNGSGGHRGGGSDLTSERGDDEEEDDDVCMLSAPPRPVRLESALLLSGGENRGVEAIGGCCEDKDIEKRMEEEENDMMRRHVAIALQQPSQQAVPSIFSLRHPLDEIRPVALMSVKDERAGSNRLVIFTDVYEKIIFVGCPEDGDRLGCRICVTFHTRLKRHAIWTVEQAPPQPPSKPLWQSTSATPQTPHNSDSAQPNANKSNIFRHYQNPEMMSPPPHDAKQQQTPAPASSTPTPSMDNMDDSSTATPIRNNNTFDENANNPLYYAHNLPPFLDLHPDIALKLLWTESPSEDNDDQGSKSTDHHRRAAHHCFFATDNVPTSDADVSPSSSPSILLCLACPFPTKRLLSLKGFSICLSSRTVRRVFDIPCLAAQPVNSVSSRSTDILVASHDDGASSSTTTLRLYRGRHRLINCQLVLNESFLGPVTTTTSSSSSSATKSSSSTRRNKKETTTTTAGGEIMEMMTNVNGLNHPVENRVDLICQSPPTLFPTTVSGDDGTTTVIRASVSLGVGHPLVEMMLTVLERRLPEMFALKLRCFVVLVRQFVDRRGGKEEDAWKALEGVILAVFEIVFYGSMRDENEIDETKEEAEDDAWWEMMHSDYHYEYERKNPEVFEFDVTTEEEKKDEEMFIPLDSCLDRETKSFVKKLISDAISESAIMPHVLCSKMFDSLHLLYEECKLSLDMRTTRNMVPLGQLLLKIAVTSPKMKDYCDHYRRDLSAVPRKGYDAKARALLEVEVLEKIKEETKEAECGNYRLSEYDEPPCFLSWVDDVLKCYDVFESNTNNVYYKSTNLPQCFQTCYPITSKMHRLYSIIHSYMPDLPDRMSQMDHELILTMVELKLTNENDPSNLPSTYPLGIILPLMETLHRVRHSPPPSFPPEAYNLISRPDLAELFKVPSSTTKIPAPTSLQSRYLGSRSHSHSLHLDPTHDPDSDGLLPLSHHSSMLFPHDERIKEATRLLRSSRPCHLHLPRPVEMTDHEYERAKQDRLLLLCRRSLALPLGRGMATLQTHRAESGLLAEPLAVPELCLAGRIPVTNATLALDVTQCPNDMTMWPEFHNGAAAGLRLLSDEVVSRTWIVYNKPTAPAVPNANRGQQQQQQQTTPPPSHSHGGLLMALGLQNHLSSLATTDIYEYLTQGNVTTTVGILLGLAASKRGTCDPSTSKMLCLHVPSLLPPSFATMEVASAAQSAAVAGIGLLYQKSGHRLMTEFLLNEMGRKPTGDHASREREGYTLSCGFALGLINLGGRKDGDEAFADVTAGLSDLQIERRLHRYVVGGTDDDWDSRARREVMERAGSAANGGEVEKCSRISEGDLINTDVTAPAAIVALGLMFLKSGDGTVARRLELPDTLFLLDYVRPDLLTLRVIARSLILWNDVKPTPEWISNHVPEVVRHSFDRLAEDAKNLASADPIAKSPPPSSAHPSSSAQARTDPPDRQAVRQIHAHVIAGACFAMGLRYAGTSNQDAKRAITQQVERFKRLRDDASDPLAMAQRPERPILELCLYVSTLGLAMVVAGSGDLEVMTLIRQLRWRCDEDVRYGAHMAYGAAMGLLFLGGGGRALRTDPEDIAALLMAFFPRFPNHTSDNQYHLQALRHCYVLAVEYRELEAVDIDTREPVYLPIEISYKDGTKHNITTPCLLPNTSTPPTSLTITSDRYFPLTLSNESFLQHHQRPPLLLVKKKSGHLTYAQDPHALRSLLVLTGATSSTTRASQIIKSFSSETESLAFAKYLCDHTFSRHKKINKKDNIIAQTFRTKRRNSILWRQTLEEFCTSVLHECLTREKPEAIAMYLSLRNSVSSLGKKTRSVCDAWDLRLIKDYYGTRKEWIMESSAGGEERLISEDFVALANEMVEKMFADEELGGETITEYESGGRLWKWGELSGCFLVWFDVPYLTDKDDDDTMDIA